MPDARFRTIIRLYTRFPHVEKIVFSKLKQFYDWYLGRIYIAPISIKNRDEFLAFLQHRCERVDRKSYINFGFPGYMSEGMLFYEHRNEVLLKHDVKYLKSTWYFHGKIVNSDSGSKFDGTYKAFPILELMSTIVLMAVILGVLSLIYMPLTGRSIGLSDVAIVLIGFPLFMLSVRFIMAPMPGVGARSIARINQLFDEYK